MNPTKTIHTGKMLDRHVFPHPHLTVQADNGRIVDVRVAEEHRDMAARHSGGTYVAYVYKGGRAYYVPRDEKEDI